jgi:hypothetical protein
MSKGNSRPVVVAFIFGELRFQMSSLQQRLPAVTDTRLAAIAHTTANLIAQLCELNRLRDRLRKAQLSARRSRRIDRRKRTDAARFQNLRFTFLAASTRR